MDVNVLMRLDYQCACPTIFVRMVGSRIDRCIALCPRERVKHEKQSKIVLNLTKFLLKYYTYHKTCQRHVVNCPVNYNNYISLLLMREADVNSYYIFYLGIRSLYDRDA